MTTSNIPSKRHFPSLPDNHHTWGHKLQSDHAAYGKNINGKNQPSSQLYDGFREEGAAPGISDVHREMKKY